MITLPNIPEAKVATPPGFDASANDGPAKPLKSDEPGTSAKARWQMKETLEYLTAEIQGLSQAVEQIKALQGIAPICAICKKVEELRHSFDRVKSLRSLVRICASCKRIRNDQGHWSQVEAYLSQHSKAQFSHGICPECMKSRYPGARQNAGA
jgi:hypothetical protein